MAGAQPQEEEEQPREPEGQRPLEVDVAEERDDEPAEPKDKDSDRPPRKERRQARNQEHIETRARELSAAENAELRREIAELRGRVSAQPPPAAPAVDPADRELESLWEQQQGILQTLRADGVTPDQADKATRRWRELEDRRLGLITDRKMREQARNAPQPQSNQVEVENRILAAEFPDVFGTEGMRMRAMAEMHDLVSSGKPASLATAREAAALVRRKHGRPTPPPPSQADRDRYTGSAGNAGASGGKTTFTPTPGQLRTARAYTAHLPDLSDADRVKRWYHEVAKPNGLVP